MIFSISYPPDVIDYNWLQLCTSPPCHSPHPHPSPGTPYQQSWTMRGPIRPPKQQHIPPKRSIFPEHPLLWVTTGSIHCCLGGMMGPPMVQECWYGVPGEGWVGGLTLDFRLMLPIVNHNRERLRKMDCFGVWWGPPVVPECWYGVPSEGWGWGGQVVWLWILGQRIQLFPTIKGA